MTVSSSPIIQRADLNALVRNRFMAVDAVTALVDDRIRSEYVVDPDSDLAYPMLIIDIQDGRGNYCGGLRRVVMHLYAYSDESQATADQVYDAAYDGLQAKRLWDSTGTISAAGYAEETERPATGWNEQTRAWYARGTWVLRVAG